jgi:dCMP deaminase
MEKELSVNKLSLYHGVFYDDLNKKWISKITIDGTTKYIGTFDREQDAALSSDYAIKKYCKEFGGTPILNFPKRPGWDEYFMNICEAVKLRSQDYYKVGSVLVSIKNNRIISTGYNSIASNLNDNIDWSQRDFISDVVIHSEMNALLYCESKFEDSILYTTTSPCANCLKMLSASKIKKIIYKNEYKDIDKVIELAKFLKIELKKYNDC